MRSILGIAAVEVRLFLRDRSNIFFVFIFPLLLILLLGSQFGTNSGQARVALSGGADTALARALTEQMEEDGLQVSAAGAGTVRDQLSRGRTDVGIFISDDDSAAFSAGRPADLEVVTASQSAAQAVLQEVRSSIQAVSTERRQQSLLEAAGVDASEAAAALEQARKAVQRPRVELVDTNDVSQVFQGLGRFDLGAAQQLLLFVFLSSLTGAATLIKARRLGVIARVMAAPVSSWQALAGQAMGRFGIAAVQGGYIMLGTSLLFGVDWGNPLLAGLVLVLFCAVSAAAAMVIGALMDNDAAASGVGVGLGLVLAGLGGSMVPPEFFSGTLQAVSRVTPHRWAYDAFADIQRHNGTLGDILPQLGVLAAMALALLALGSFLLQRSLSRAL
ncbi:ABC-type multidrug transport system, permease component [Pseudarthrobacter phenanthrenivorans Sphe3]|uniref:ABC-type multidrug transport system, permease component n=1 Tax=Pseudarthrobacter phenanthrenivorans (strain DSM 18606 / JCM 16027 / LMG 23796 / Sphe3) TaxID=930171 RepID=F0M343_PSEPM|nr:ABC transporter permease [Pseudarthrobacter phenanthrenivorans]ADX73264.1 ABC-type multidrug transport system, permease component [Pseudarthrobacter phenanthrenivorans Sphe3]